MCPNNNQMIWAWWCMPVFSDMWETKDQHLESELWGQPDNTVLSTFKMEQQM